MLTPKESIHYPKESVHYPKESVHYHAKEEIVAAVWKGVTSGLKGNHCAF